MGYRRGTVGVQEGYRTGTVGYRRGTKKVHRVPLCFAAVPPSIAIKEVSRCF